jgi:hypothetical protein
MKNVCEAGQMKTAALSLVIPIDKTISEWNTTSAFLQTGQTGFDFVRLACGTNAPRFIKPRGLRFIEVTLRLSMAPSIGFRQG